MRMSEYKTIKYLAAEETMKPRLPEFCAHCLEHTREHGDCYYAGTPDAIQCPRVQREIERLMSEQFKPIIGVEQL